MMDQKTGLSKEQLHRLMEAFCRARGADKVTEIEAQCIVKWAEDTMIEHSLLQMVLQGKLNIDWGSDEPLFVDA